MPVDQLILLAQVAEEAERVRKILNERPPNDDTDMLYAAYNALLFVLGYHVYPPSELFDGASSKEKIRRRMGARTAAEWRP